MNEDKTIILKTSLITMGVIIVLAIIVFSINVFCFPAKMADFMFDLGLKTFASDLYYKDYKKSGEIESLGMSLNIRIELNHNDKTIELCEEFFDHEKYSEHITNLNSKNLNSNFNLYTKSKLIAEDNYYKNAYIKALIALNKIDEAYNYSKLTFENIEATFKDLKVYVFSHMIGKIEDIKFNQKLNDLDSVVLYEKINNYFNNLYEIFEVKSNALEEGEEVYIYALSSRILQVGNDLKSIDERIETSLNIIDIDLKLNTVAEFMQALLEE